MNWRRKSAAAALVASLALLPAGAAHAQSKPVPCGGTPQVTDPEGDGHHIQEDILSGFLRSDGGVVSANIEIADLKREIAHDESKSAQWDFQYVIGKKTYRLRARLLRTDLEGIIALAYTADLYNKGQWQSVAASEGRFIEGPNGIISMRMPVAAGGKPGTKIRAIRIATSESSVNAQGTEQTHDVDEARTSTPFTIANCGSGAQLPVPCSAPQVTDVDGDGHHRNEDVLSGFFGYEQGKLTANVQIRDLDPKISHAENVESYFRTIFKIGKQSYWVGTRLSRSAPAATDLAITHEYGRFDGKSFASGTFVTLGETEGHVWPGVGGVFQDVIPASLGATVGSRVDDPVIVVGESAAANGPVTAVHWVDRAPGGENPLDSHERKVGADFTVAECKVNPLGAGDPDPPTDPTGPTGPSGPTGPQVQVVATAVAAAALAPMPNAIDFGQTVTAQGTVAPALGGLSVSIVADPGGATTVRTGAEGGFTAALKPQSTTTFHAEVGAVRSADRTVRVRSLVRLAKARFKRVAGRRVARFDGSVAPDAEGTVELQRKVGRRYRTVTTGELDSGAFHVSLARARAGRYRVRFESDSGERDAGLSRSVRIKVKGGHS